MIRVALYARVSTRDQHPDNQIMLLREYAKRQGWEIVCEYQEIESGVKYRPVLNVALQAAARRDFDRLVVFALDRLSREGPAQTFALVERLRISGVELWSMTEEHFRTAGPAGELLFAVASWIAKQERNRMRERICAGQARARALGRHSGRPRRVVDLARLAEMRDEGKSWQEIGRAVGISASTAFRRHNGGGKF